MKSERPYSITCDDGLYFVTFAVVYWIDVFSRLRYKDIIVDSLNFCTAKKGLEIYAWCLMSNHIHLIIRAEEGYKLSNILRDFKKYTASQIIQSIQSEPESRREWMIWMFERAAKKNARNTHHQFWQQDNHAEELFSNQFMEQKLDYIHQNPVKEGLVALAEQYLYSSARDYTGEQGLVKVSMIM
ncbi:MAG: transposase [Microscillaceae bacterium]|nr:transposase [Microscillaceae bacterium]